MTIEARIGIIGGNGWLGNAIAKATVASGTIAPERLLLSGRERRDVPAVPGVRMTTDNRVLVENADVIVVSVRPEQFADLDIDAKGKFVVSVMAGIPAHTVSKHTGADKVVRALPSAAASIGCSFTPWFATKSVSAEDKALVQSFFAACGEAAEAPLEAHIDYCVAMTGSGAAFPALLAEAMIDHAVEQGLPRSFAAKAARSVVTQASQLFAGAQGDSAGIVQAMIDYRGTTGEALQTMLDQGFNEAVAAGLEAASTKASELASSA